MLFKIIFGSLSGAIGLAVAIIEGLFYIGCFIVLFQILNYFHVWIYVLQFCAGAFIPFTIFIWLAISNKKNK